MGKLGLSARTSATPVATFGKSPSWSRSSWPQLSVRLHRCVMTVISVLCFSSSFWYGWAVPAPSIKYLLRSLTADSQDGTGPLPLQVAPDFGSRYLAGCNLCAVPLCAPTPPAFEPSWPRPSLYSRDLHSLREPLSALPAIRNLLRSLTLAIRAGTRPCPFRSLPF
jgi:hypothetical protein